MKLIIAEKPSLGRNIAGSIGAKSRGDGFLFGDDYIVTWVFGHLFSLADIEPSETSNPSIKRSSSVFSLQSKSGRNKPLVTEKHPLFSRTVCVRA